MSVHVEGIAAIGDVLAGKYRVDKILGIGGMGMVVAATHLELSQRVAIKFMLPGSPDSPESAARFLREARAAGRLNSDHVCRVMDVGRFDSGAPYIVMEYLQGENFNAMLRRRGPMRVSEAVDYILQGIEGIAEAHAHGIIHRDLKPDNLFLHKRNDGGTIVKVLDFGISKARTTGYATKTGDIMGSPAYMAPEQMESTRDVDHRADVWSLGVVLYQLVVGKAPFQGDTLPLLCLAVANDEPKLMSETRGDLPDGFEAAVMRCLRKEPTERYADVGELAEALAAFGPKNATTSASRIQIVLRRARLDSAAVISNEFAMVEPAAVADEPEPPAGPVPGHVTAPREPVTRAPTPGLSLAMAAGPSRRLIGALVVGIAVVGLAIVMVWRNGRGDDDARAEPSRPAKSAPVASPSSPGLAPSAALPPTPIVEPILDEPSAAPVAESPPAVAAPGAPVDPPAPKAEPKKRKPHRSPGAAARAGAGSGSAGAARGSGSAADDDDKWMHMTHDQKKP